MPACSITSQQQSHVLSGPAAMQQDLFQSPDLDIPYVALQGIPLQLALPPESPLIAQPPHDSRMGAAAMLHYTWGSIFTHPSNKSEVWKFDKRFYTEPSIQINVRGS